MAGPRDLTLPRDLLEAQLSMVDLIRAMYPSPEDEADSSSANEIIDRVREWCDSSEDPPSTGVTITRLPSAFGLTVTIPVHTDDDSSTSAPAVEMSVTVPLSSTENDLIEPPPLTYSLRQPQWLSRAEVAELGGDMPMDDILAAFDYIQDNAPRYYQNHLASLQQEKPEAGVGGGGGEDDGPLLRVWFYFPSLSTREKRKDLVSYASGYALTGFVLAGKPGVLCLEGTSRNVDGYMNAIKNESWGDIPSHQKKVSERFREECGVEGRKFVGMREITDNLGERRGARKNRGDMAALEAWLKEMGVGESFSRVIMGG
ncbi:RWD domain-containing protein 2B [Cytospora mali]|uniref:RWD domain-containing protein 2B n=1 Tax=Cytospora mali TaxID=578113 RepID=A0A194UXJ3_CYTMA|nr:RWD domain-containing protein 2B [Valsa mali var. pyri (nom. inval.)]